MMRNLCWLVTLLLTGISMCVATESVTLTPNPVFTDHMVLQRGMSVPVWGTAAAGDAITVTFAGQTKNVVADAVGRWMIRLDPLVTSSIPAELVIQGRTEVRLRDVLVGEVWLASGQSNMEWPVAGALNAQAEIDTAQYAQIRLLQVAKTSADAPADQIRDAKWVRCSPETVKDFSAVAYFFGRELHRKLQVPIGLINSSWGGTDIEAWIGLERLQKLPFTAKAVNALLLRRQNAYANWDGGINPLPRVQNNSMEGNAGFCAGWAASGLPTKGKWGRMELPAQWQQRGLDVSGIFWFRKTITVPANWLGQDLRLAVGAIDKEDITYFNNTPVGAIFERDCKASYRTPRVYNIPARLVKQGENVIAVRVRSPFFDGGMTGPAPEMTLSCPAVDHSLRSLAGSWEYAIESNYGLCRPDLPTALYNGMIRPLVPYAVRGVLWYQGENNTSSITRALEYRQLLSALIDDWRNLWGQGEFAFNIVQLANWRAPSLHIDSCPVALVREAQAMALSLPQTMLAVTVDLGEEDCHFRNKQDVGRRLAANAFAQVYGIADTPYRGPVFKHAVQDAGAIRVVFDFVANGLQVGSGTEVKGFVVAGADQKYFPARATLVGKDTVLLVAPEVPAPRFVRYAWADNPLGNLFNSDNLPARPFRTDRQD